MKRATGRALALALLFLSSVSVSVAELVVYYAYEEIDAGWIRDLSGNGIDGQINGDVSLDAGRDGQAGKFAQGSYLDLDGPGVPQGLIPTDGFTLTAWVNIENTGEHHAIFNARASDATWLIHPEVRNTSDQYRWLLRTSGGVTIFDVRAGAPVVSDWVHFAGTYSRADGVGILYIDGQEVGRETARIADAPVAGDWGMGARVGFNIDNARPFTGLMDEFALWNDARSLDEIVDIMDNGPMGSDPTAVSREGKLATTWAEIRNFDHTR